MAADWGRPIGVARIRLFQRRYSDGALYISTSLKDGDAAWLDFRYWVEDELRLFPTVNGFRIQRPEFTAFRTLCSRRPDDLAELILWSRGERRLVVNRCDDQYGKGVSVRYFRQSPAYTGWEKRGIRLVDEDFLTVCALVNDTNILAANFRPAIDVFESKELGEPRVRVSTPGSGRGKRTAEMTTRPASPIELALAEFLSGD